MKTIPAIPFPGIEEFVKNIDLYKDEFIKENILLFRGANLTEEEQVGVQKIINQSFGSFPSTHTQMRNTTDYTEDHRDIKNKIDDIILSWHIEHPYFDNPIVLGLWNMILFDPSNEGGHTLFVSCTDAYKMLSLEEQDFLNLCYHKEQTYPPLQDMIVSLKENNIDFCFKIVQKHWLTNEPVLRMRFPIAKEADMSPALEDINKFSMLYSVERRVPTLEEKMQYHKICQKIVRFLHSEEDYVKIQKWQQGDLLLVDIHSLIHAVTGGFTSEKRKFLGLWSYQHDLLTQPKINVEKRLQNKSL